jgi:hypothetical protein
VWIGESPILKSLGSRNSVATLAVWPPAPTLASLQLSFASQQDAFPSASLLSAHGYLAQKPVIKTARRETFCFADNPQTSDVATRQAIDRLYEDFFHEQTPLLLEDSAKGQQAAKPWGDGAFLDFMINSGTISRGRRSKGRQAFELV